MPISDVNTQVQSMEIEAYRRPKDWSTLKQEHVCFTGAPFRLSGDREDTPDKRETRSDKEPPPGKREKMILLVDPASANTFYYEFRLEDISYMEPLPNVVDDRGEGYPMARVWVKKGAVGIRSTPFVVENLRVL